MTPEIRRAAVRAAAKAALLTAIGCGGAQAPAPAPSNAAADKPAAAIECGSFLDGIATVKKEELPDGDPMKTSNFVYGRVFADRAVREGADVQKCCNEEIAAKGAGAKHRWECCAGVKLTDEGSACTPWGPPCPPAMPV